MIFAFVLMIIMHPPPSHLQLKVLRYSVYFHSKYVKLANIDIGEAGTRDLNVYLKKLIQIDFLSIRQ